MPACAAERPAFVRLIGALQAHRPARALAGGSFRNLLGCFRCGPASGSVPLNSYRYSPFVSTLQARVLARYLRVIFAPQFGNYSRNRPQSWRGSGAKTATHIPSERPNGCGRFGPAKSPKLGPMPTATWPYARPTPKRAAKSTQNLSTDGNSKGENRPNRPERKHARKASSCGLHLSLSLLSAGARTIRLVPFPFPMGLRPSHPRSRKQDVASEQARRHASARHPASTRRILPHPTSNNRTQRIPKRHARRARRASCALCARCGACLRYHGCDQRERTNHAARNAPTEERRAGFRRMGQ